MVRGTPLKDEKLTDMKNIIILFSILVGLGQHLNAQIYSCVRNVSTNPNNPFNTEWQTITQQNYPTDPGSFINTGFSWYLGSNSLAIYPQLQNWNLPPSYQNTHYMKWPFAMNNDDLEGSNAYLYDHIDDTDRDYHWEGGWELLWMNLGYLPNGIKNDRNRIINVHRI